VIACYRRYPDAQRRCVRYTSRRWRCWGEIRRLWPKATLINLGVAYALSALGETSESSLVGLTAGRSAHPEIWNSTIQIWQRMLRQQLADVLFSTSLARRESIWPMNLPSIVRTIVLGSRWYCAFSHQTSCAMSLRLNQVPPEVVTQHKEGARSTWTAKSSDSCRSTAGI
jgi:hypothetical protein